jgi:flagellar L-ring protein precursor FlgH
MKKLLLISSLFILLFTGCISERLEPKIDFNKKPHTKQSLNKSQKDHIAENNSSLFHSNYDLYSSNSKALDVGDIIQINIIENIKSDSIGERKTNKTNNTDLGGGVVAPFTTTAGTTLYNGVNRFTNKVNSALNLGFQTNSANSFTGKTSAKHDEKFTATISAIIQDKYPNGNYFVYGQKEILIDGQLQIIQISGTVRPYDIKSPDNSVSSSKLANAKIMYKKQGIEHDSTVKPWATSIIENVWPF